MDRDDADKRLALRDGDEADALAAELAEARAELEALRGKYG